MLTQLAQSTSFVVTFGDRTLTPRARIEAQLKVARESNIKFGAPTPVFTTDHRAEREATVRPM